MNRWAPNTRDRILVVAGDLLAANDFDTASIATICGRACITKSTYFRYFRNKDGLLHAIMDGPAGVIVMGIRAAPATATALEAVAIGLQHLLDTASTENDSALRSALDADDELARTHLFYADGLAHSISEALAARGVDAATAQLVALIGLLALRRGHAHLSRNIDSVRAAWPSTAAALQEFRGIASVLGRQEPQPALSPSASSQLDARSDCS